MNVFENRRVLVIDDNEAIHGDFRKVLCAPKAPLALLTAEAALFGPELQTQPNEARDFEVDGALQGQRGLELVEKAKQSGTPYALAFVDMRMPPGWNGVETIERLWRADPDLQVVICTAYSDYSGSEITARLGRSDNLLFLKKPFDNFEVWQMACSLTEKWSLRQQATAKLREAQELAHDLRRSNEELQREVRQRREAEETLQHSVMHDALTGLPNRRHLLERIQRSIELYRRDPTRKFAVLFLDIDNFKIVNDSLGHQHGDLLLELVANSLRASLRSLDTIGRIEAETTARLGGDEFVVLLEGVPSAVSSAVVAQRLIDCLPTAFEIEGTSVPVTFSVGIAVGDASYTSPTEVLRDADIAMYRAKTAGKARYAIFDPEMHRAARSRLQLENDLRRAIAEDEFRLAYQPIVHAGTRRLVGFEALIRWDRGPHMDCSPAQFVPVAEESGLIVPIGKWVLQAAALQMQEWRRSVPGLRDVTVSVNVSRRQLLDPDLVDLVRAVLAPEELAGRWLNLEVTESGVIEDFDAAAIRLSELKRLGVGLHMDDFGTGYSSLSCLHRLPFDVVKVDRAFTRSMQDNASYAAVIRAVVSLARSLNMKVTVEGIETVEQLEMISDLGCDYGQGYLFARPVTPNEALRLLQADSAIEWATEAAGQ
ncbi:MAG: putative bifunctional diguanylate cyclase/phosphodiesterase [Planctomycetota bacterium]